MMQPNARLPASVFALIVALVLTGGCARLKKDGAPLEPSQAVTPGPEGAFGDIEKALIQRHGQGTSGFLLLFRNEDALRWRLAVIDSAKVSLDFQYHVWFADSEVGGTLLLERAIEAAQRGIRVRILVDDIEFDDKGAELASLDAQDNIEIRIFNPWETREVGRVGRALEWISKMNQLNYRMHNKLLIADNQIAVVGGRNLGDHYFGLADDFAFHDADLLASGPIVRETSEAFDHFWNSDWVVSGSAFGEPWDQERWEMESVENRKLMSGSGKLDRFGLDRRDWAPYLDNLPERMHPGKARIAYDRLETQAPNAEAYQALETLLVSAEHEILVANAYLIPDDRQIEGLRRTVERGIRVRTLTNSLGSNDVPVVNSAYRRSRERLVGAGAELYELKHDGELLHLQGTPPTSPEFLALHMKAFVMDRRYVYIGSLNLDPRSMNINTEKAVIIDSPSLADTLARGIELSMQPANAWRVRLDQEGRLLWISGEEITDEQPARDIMQRITDDILSILPLPVDQL